MYFTTNWYVLPGGSASITDHLFMNNHNVLRDVKSSQVVRKLVAKATECSQFVFWTPRCSVSEIMKPTYPKEEFEMLLWHDSSIKWKGVDLISQILYRSTIISVMSKHQQGPKLQNKSASDQKNHLIIFMGAASFSVRESLQWSQHAFYQCIGRRIRPLWNNDSQFLKLYSKSFVRVCDVETVSMNNKICLDLCLLQS